MTTSFSIITPVYNNDIAQVERAVKSVEGQGVSCEMIIVDDGSQDTLPNQLDQLASLYPFLKVIHKPNGGVSSARNVAIAQCGGDYVFFLDADDEIEEGALAASQTLLEANECDAVYGNMLLIFPNGSTQTGWPPFEESGEFVLFECEQLDYLKAAQFRPDSLRQFKMPSMLIPNNCSALFKGDIIRKIRFDEGIVMAEDRLFNLKFLSLASRVGVTDAVWYKYYQDENAATHRIRPHALEEFEATALKYEQLIASSTPLVENSLYSGIFECFLQTLIFTIPRRQFNKNMGMPRTQYTKKALATRVFKMGIDNAAPTSSWQDLIMRLAKGNHPRLINGAIMGRSLLKR